MDWKTALKVGGPSVIAAWLFYALIVRYLDSSNIFKGSIYLNVLLVVVIFVFCLSMGWLWIKKDGGAEMPPTTVEENEVVDNEVGADMEIGANSEEVKNNKIKRNKVNGNLKIG